MSKAVLILDGQELTVEANAQTLLIYEDNFKGHRLLQDIDELAHITDKSTMPFGIYLKLLWACAKTADKNIVDIDLFSQQFSIEAVIENSWNIIELIGKSIEGNSKKVKAAATQNPI